MNARLAESHAELEQRVQERTEQLDRTLAHQLLLAKRMVRIRDEERKRLAADLHDGVAQDVTSLGVSLDLIRHRAAREEPALARRAPAARRWRSRGARATRCARPSAGCACRAWTAVALATVAAPARRRIRGAHRHPGQRRFGAGARHAAAEGEGRAAAHLPGGARQRRKARGCSSRCASRCSRDARITSPESCEDDGRGFDPARPARRQRERRRRPADHARARHRAGRASSRALGARAPGTRVECVIAAEAR